MDALKYNVHGSGLADIVSVGNVYQYVETIKHHEVRKDRMGMIKMTSYNIFRFQDRYKKCPYISAL